MTCEVGRNTLEPEQAETTEVRVGGQIKARWSVAVLSIPAAREDLHQYEDMYMFVAVVFTCVVSSPAGHSGEERRCVSLHAARPLLAFRHRGTSSSANAKLYLTWWLNIRPNMAAALQVRAYHGVCWVLGFRQPQETALVNPAVSSPARQSLAGRKRLRRVTRLLLSILPRWVQGAMGYPVSSSIGRTLSPGMLAV